MKTEEIIKMIEDENPLLFPPELSEIYDLLIKSKNLLKDYAEYLEENDADPIPQEILQNTQVFIASIAYNVFSSHNFVVSVPEINPCYDGTIDVVWVKNSEAIILFNVNDKEDKIIVHYYGGHPLIEGEKIYGKMLPNEEKSDIYEWIVSIEKQ